jgi:hypothetical protein
MNGKRDSFQSGGDDEHDEEFLKGVVAISPEDDLYFDYEDIPPIPSPSFLMVKDGTIVADRWIIEIRFRKSFLDFAAGLCTQWNDHTDEGRRQLCAFVEAIEQEVNRINATHSE